MTDFIPSTSIDLSDPPKSGTKNIPSQRQRKKSINLQKPVQEPEVIQAIRSWRARDNRQWSDVEVQEFPAVFFYNLHQEEWRQNEVLSQKVLKYLSFESTNNQHILDVGSGTGWFSNLLVRQTNAKVTGLDLMDDQVQQAKKNFSHERLSYRTGDFFTSRLRKNSFDHLIFLHSLPWLGSMDQVVKRANSLLKSGGTIHIMGTSFPSPKKFDKARASFEEYCADKRMSAILEFYQLTPKTELERLGFTDMSAGSSFASLFGKKSAPCWYIRKKS